MNKKIAGVTAAVMLAALALIPLAGFPAPFTVMVDGLLYLLLLLAVAAFLAMGGLLGYVVYRVGTAWYRGDRLDDIVNVDVDLTFPTLLEKFRTRRFGAPHVRWRSTRKVLARIHKQVTSDDLTTILPRHRLLLAPAHVTVVANQATWAAITSKVDTLTLMSNLLSAIDHAAVSHGWVRTGDHVTVRLVTDQMLGLNVIKVEGTAAAPRVHPDLLRGQLTGPLSCRTYAAAAAEADADRAAAVPAPTPVVEEPVPFAPAPVPPVPEPVRAPSTPDRNDDVVQTLLDPGPAPVEPVPAVAEPVPADADLPSTRRTSAQMLLTQTTGAGNRAQYLLPGTAGTIGRATSTTCPIATTDDTDTISRSHAEWKVEAGTLVIRDLNSFNGTYLNGVRVRSSSFVAVKPGDRLRLGEVEFLVSDPAHAADASRGEAVVDPTAEMVV